MKKILLIILKTVGCLAIVIAVLVTVAFFVVNSPSIQNKVQRKTTAILAQKLGTKVEIDSVSIDLLKGGVSLYRLALWDQKNVKMLNVDTVQVSLGIWALTQKNIEINKATLAGCKAVLYKLLPDTVANYQFIIDSLKRKPTTDTTIKPKKKKNKFSLDIGKITLRRIELSYETSKTRIPLILRSKRMKPILDAQRKKRKFVEPEEEKRWLMQKVSLEELVYKKARFGRHKKGVVTVKNLNYWNDNGLPRKNTGRKNRGWFDSKHMDITLNIDAKVNYFEPDSMNFSVVNMTAKDSVTGFDFSDLHFNASLKKGIAKVTDFHVTQQKNTTLEFDSATFILPSKKIGRKLQFKSSEIKGKTLLKNISRPFAPMLKGFELPLELRVQVAGNDTSIYFNNIYVYTPDSLIQVYAYGDIQDLKNKYDLLVHFKVTKMIAKGAIKHRVINQFTVKKYMMSQVNKLGTIRYKGNIYVLWKKVQFDGVLGTAIGGLDFDFYLDGNDKYLVGRVSSNSLNLAKLTDMKNLGNLVCSASFKFDISKPRTALMRKKIGGKLPMGRVDAVVKETYFKKIKFSNIYATIESNGAIAEGNIVMKGKRMDGLCKFSFTNTDSISKMKIKPGIRFHKMSDEDKAARDKEKAAKAAEKEKAKAAKAAEKEKAAKAKAAEKEKAAKEKAIAKEKAAQEKAAAKAAKKAEKERKKAEKAAAKEKAAQEKAAKEKAKAEASSTE